MWYSSPPGVDHSTAPSTNSTRYRINNKVFSCSFLASGDLYHTLAGCFRTAVCTVSIIITRVCEAIWECLWQKYLPTPKQHDWSHIETGFRLRWDYPNCVGAIDGNHIAIRAPPGSASLYFNYKNHFSIILMAAVDAGYRFIVVDVGNYGSNSDTGITAFWTEISPERVGTAPKKTSPVLP